MRSLTVNTSLEEFKKLLERLYKDFCHIFNQVSEITYFYLETCVSMISDIEISKFPRLLESLSEIYPYESCKTIQGYIDFTNWLSQKANFWKDIKLIEDFSNIDFGTTVDIASPNKDCYQLQVGEKCLCLEEGFDDDICISLYKNDEEIAWGYIYVSYGKVENDENYSIGNAIDSEVRLQVEKILEQIRFIRDEWKEYFEKEQNTISEIKRIIEENSIWSM